MEMKTEMVEKRIWRKNEMEMELNQLKNMDFKYKQKFQITSSKLSKYKYLDPTDKY